MVLSIVETARVSRVYQITFDYKDYPAKMIASGKYGQGCISECVTAENFPSQREGIVTLDTVLFYPRCQTAFEMVLAELEKMKIRAPTMAELLAFGAAFPDEYDELPITGLGQVYVNRYGESCVGSIDNLCGKRWLILSCLAEGFSSDYSFLAICD